MRVLRIITFISVLVAVSGYPLKHRATSGDMQILAFATVLEQLESAFYTEALKQFNASNFKAAGFVSSEIPIQQFQAIASDESIHATTLQSTIKALGGRVQSNCTFNFSSALTDVNTMVATARVIENVGVGAYLGALSKLVDPTLVMAASSIMTVEARHQTILNLLSNATSIPQPFDVALSPPDVLAIANTFIHGCNLGFAANPSLAVRNNTFLQPGTKLYFSSPALNGTTSQLSCKIVTGRLNSSLDQPMDNCVVPANITGPLFVFITDKQNATSELSSSNANRGINSSTVIAGPALLFINQPDFIGSLIRPNLNTSSAPGNQTSLSAPPAVTSTTPPIPGTTPMFSPSPGVYTTTLSPSQASAALSSLIGY